MATVLAPQAWGAYGETPTLAAADGTGNYVPGNGPDMVLIVINAGGASRRVRLNAGGPCSNGRTTHYRDITIPNDSQRKVIPLGMGRARQRFGSEVSITYPDGVTGLTVAASRLTDHYGVGADAETPTALGSTPGTIPITENAPGVEPTMVAADADGMVLAGNNGRTPIWMENTGIGARTIYIHGLVCDHGIQDDEVITLGAGRLEMTLDLPIARFGRQVSVTYDSANDPTGLRFGAIRQGTYPG